MAAVPVTLTGVAPSTTVAPEEVSAMPLLVPVCVRRTFPADELAVNGAAPLAVLMAVIRPAKLVVAVFSVTEYGVAPSDTVKVSGVTLKSKRDGAAELKIVEGVPADGGTGAIYGVYELTEYNPEFAP